MKLITSLAIVVLLAAQGQPPPVCDGSEEPCQEGRPWMRGRVEKSCAVHADVEKLRKDNPGKTIVECACKHTCDPLYEHSDETDGRKWDAKCGARCDPKNCKCKHPCDS